MAISQYKMGSSDTYFSAWTGVPADIDIEGLDPQRAPTSGGGRCSREIIVGVAGTLVCTRNDGVIVTLTLPVGRYAIAAKALGAASTAQNVTVLY